MSRGARSDLITLAVLLTAAVLSLLVAVELGQPWWAEFMLALEPGVGLKEAAKWSFGTTVVLLVPTFITLMPVK